METLTIITGCLTGIIESSSALYCLCITVTVLTLGILGFIFWMRILKYNHLEKEKKAERDHELALKKEEKAAKVEEEKQLFRQQLTSFLEMRAKDLKKDANNNDLTFNDNFSNSYIKELKSLINTLNPTN